MKVYIVEVNYIRDHDKQFIWRELATIRDTLLDARLDVRYLEAHQKDRGISSLKANIRQLDTKTQESKSI